MINCPVCGKEITVKNLDSSFQISLGNMLNGRFYEGKKYFCHIDCLSDGKSYKKKYLYLVF